MEAEKQKKGNSLQMQRYVNLEKDIKRLAGEPVAIYGTGEAMNLLLTKFDLSMVDIIGLVDRDNIKVGTKIHGYTVYTINEIKKWVKAIIIASNDAWDIIYDRIKHLENEGIEIVKSSFIGSTVFDEVHSGYFQKIKSLAQSSELFKSMVDKVEVEIFSYCNRRCWFCPNSYLDRHSTNHYLPENAYMKLLNDLSDINYSNLFSYHCYNEPLADDIVYTRIKQSREMMPDAKLDIYTNGDYVTKENIARLYKAGLNSLNIQAYLPKDELFIEEIVLARMKKLLYKIGLPHEMTRQDHNEWYQARIAYKDMEIRLYSRNFAFNGYDRGALVDVGKKEQRSLPCMAPFKQVIVNFNGYVTPCCNIRSDAPQHKNYILGNIIDKSIFEIYSSSNIIEWRKRLFNYEIKKEPPCNSCIFNQHPYDRQTYKNALSECIKSLHGSHIA